MCVFATTGRDACRLGALAADGAPPGGQAPGADGAASQRPLDYNSRLGVSEHVERIISEATSLDNLAMMYEGWTSWI